MRGKKLLFLFVVLILLIPTFVNAQNVGERISIEGIVESAGRNSLYVDGKILVANEYSVINTAGTNIFVGDYVMGFVYLNDDMQSYTIEMLNKIPEKSIGTPTPGPTMTPTDAWHDLFTPTPNPADSELRLLIDQPEEEIPDVLWDQSMFGIMPTATPTIVPTATPSSVAFEGPVDEINGRNIVISGVQYYIDNSSSFKDPNTMPAAGDYVRGRAAPYSDALLIRYLEIVPAYDQPGAETRTVYGLYQSQDTTRINISTPEEEVTGMFYPYTKMSKTFYTKNTLVSAEMVGEYVKNVMDYPLVQSGSQLEPVNGEITEIIKFSENEIYIISDNLAYLVNSETRYIPDVSGFQKGSPFIGLKLNGRIVLLCFTDNNRVKTIKGQVSFVGTEDGLVVFNIGGIEYYVTKNTMLSGENLVKNSQVYGYADSQNMVFYLNVDTPWYSAIMDWNWTLILPAATAIIALILFLLLHRTRVQGFIQEVNGNIITLTDAMGNNKRHYRCIDEIARFAGSLVTMKVELTVYHGKVIFIKYDF